MSTIPLLFAAHKLGYETTPTMTKNESLTYTPSFNRHYTVGCGKGSEIIYSISSSKDSKIAKEIQRDKWSSNLLIEKLGLPLPAWEIIDSFTEIEEIWKRFDKPVVIKPTGLTGGSGVCIGIKTIEEAKEAYKYAKQVIDTKIRKDWQTKVMIQEQVSGEDYRLLVINGKLEIATKRIPAFVIGDGKNTIDQLIKNENLNPKRDTKNPAHILKPIVIDKPLLEFLEDQGLTLQSIPQKDEKISVRKVASMSQGGITQDFTDSVSKEIKILVESIARSIHAFTL
jgi:cyanophycin synthetase